ncbi:NUDIX domain-containing protein [Peribacillus sp. SCS-37]|uniref:NUDIX domain-containing protein n=1 Tax=Paraperibacillus esterisolvens TaxID=3115296 RepID=UPI0039060A89
MRKRSAAVILHNSRAVLIRRKRENEVYYVFPGGGIEAGESAEEAAIRECMEEIGVSINIKDFFMSLEFKGTQHYYLAEINNGEIISGEGKEYTDPERDRGTYQPLWVSIGDFPRLDIRPWSVAEKVIDMTQ